MDIAQQLHRGILAAAVTAAMLMGSLATAQETAEFASASDLESEAQAMATLMEDVRAYQEAVETMENERGAYADGLSEQLLGLGLALQRNGDHPGAIDAFKRGVHLSRINDGLYSDRQMALLQGEIASLVALGSLAEADERQRYLFRVQRKTLSDVTRGQALMQHAVWQRKAYEAGIGEEPHSRLLRMWSLYRLALTEIAQAEGQESELLLPPLFGMLRAQYLSSGFVGETTSGVYRTRGLMGDEESMQLAYRANSYKQGAAVIEAIYDVQQAQEDAKDVDAAYFLMMLGDWQLWHGKRNDALETYGTLYRELEGSDAAQAFRETLFDAPQPLPSLEGVRALPQADVLPDVAPAEGESEQRDGRLLLEFGVNERGKVVDLVRLDSVPANDAKADAIMRRMRQTLFRPRISDGMPVETQGLRWAYDINNW